MMPPKGARFSEKVLPFARVAVSLQVLGVQGWNWPLVRLNTSVLPVCKWEDASSENGNEKIFSQGEDIWGK